jgi:GNAT superfamily N-acetyltransferase
MRGGGEYTVRPIHPDDAQMLQELVRKLSPESRYFRFVSSMAGAARHDAGALHADRLRPRDGAGGGAPRAHGQGADGEITSKPRASSACRAMSPTPTSTSCEFSLVVADDFKGKGLGSRLMLSIMDFAREKGLAEIEGLVLTPTTRHAQADGPGHGRRRFRRVPDLPWRSNWRKLFERRSHLGELADWSARMDGALSPRARPEQLCARTPTAASIKQIRNPAVGRVARSSRTPRPG